MKKIFSILIIALAFCSCEKEAIDPVVENTPIVFGEVQTRADVIEYPYNEFGVFAFMNNGAAGTPEAGIYSPLFDLAGKNYDRVYKSGEDWTYDNVRYWMSGRTFQFLGFYPYSQTVTPVKNATTYSGYSLTFVTPDAANVDLMTAQATVDEETSDPFPPESVELAFNHELVKVNVVVEQDFDKNPFQEFCVNYMSLSNIRRTGTLTISSLGEEAAHSWTYDASATPLQFAYNAPVADTPIRNLEGRKVMLRTDDVMLIPQAAGTINLSLNYAYGTYNSESVLEWDYRTANVNLPASTWKAGTQVTYSIKLSEDNEISFVKVTVASWGKNQSGGTIIIK